MRIVVTGSRGRVGAAVAEHCTRMGADVLGVDHTGMGNAVDYLNVDLTDLGQVYDALHGADTVIHLAAVPHSRRLTAARTLANNVTASYNVFLAAQQLGIQRVVAASSIQVMHRGGFSARANFQYFPLDESHPPDPKDEYGLSKLMLEKAADMFALHYGMTMVSLRYTWVCPAEDWPQLPHRTPQVDEAIDPLPFCVHIDDAAHAAYLAATAGLPPSSHTVAFIAARDSRFDLPTAEFLRRFYPTVAQRKTFAGYESPISTLRAEEAFGFLPRYSCHSLSTE